MKYTHSVSDFFRPLAWRMNLLLGGVAMLIPMIGPIVLNGWHIAVFWTSPQRDGAEKSPPFVFDDILRYLERAIWPFLVSLVVGFTLVIPLAAVMIALFFAVMVGAEDKNLPFVLIPLMYGLQIIWGLFYYLIGTPFVIRATLLQDFAGAFDFRFARDFIAKMWREMLCGALFLVLVWIAAMVAGMALCFVGVYFTMTVALFAAQHVKRQLYETWLAKGGVEVPVSPKLMTTPPPLPG